MSILAALRAIHTEDWLIAESKYASYLSLAQSLLNRELSTPTQEEFKATFQSGERFLSGTSQSYSYEPHLLPNGVLLMPLFGVLFKMDFCGKAGTATIANWYELAQNDPSVKAIVEITDSPGGMASGTEFLYLTKQRVMAQKPIVEYVNEMMCSAALWIGAASDYVIASTATAVIGSLGVIFTYSKKDATSSSVEIYPKTSSRKNYASRQADKGNFTALEEKAAYLDNVFMSAMQSARPAISQLALDGEEFFTKEAIANGLVDSQGTLQDAIDKALSLVAAPIETSAQNQISNNKQLSNKMNFNEIALGAMLGSMSISLTKADATAKSPDEILSEMSAKYSGQATTIATLTAERDAANLAKTGLEAEKTILTTQVADLTAKVQKLPAGKPAAMTLKEGDATLQDTQDTTELPSLKWLRENG